MPLFGLQFVRVEDNAATSNDDEIDSVAQRLLLEGPSLARLTRLTVAFSAYHAVKFSLPIVQAAEVWPLQRGADEA